MNLFGLLDGAGDGETTSSRSTRASTRPSSVKPLSTTLWTSTRTDSTEPTATVTTALATPTPSILPVSDETHATDHSSKTWQIIGIVIIAILFIAVSITCAMFFDRLWRFLKDAISCNSRPLVSEEFVPDCEKQTLDASTVSSLPSGLDHTTRARELPWNTDHQDWNTLHRQPSRRNDHPPTT